MYAEFSQHSEFLQDLEVHFSLSPASLSTVQVPADEKVQLKASTQDRQSVGMICTHHNTCMAKNHALMVHFTSMACKHFGVMHIQRYKHKQGEQKFKCSTNLKLNSHPKFIHFSKILKHKFYGLHDSVSISAGAKVILYCHYFLFKRNHFIDE